VRIWLDTTSAAPSRAAPAATTRRAPIRSETTPATNEPTPKITQLTKATPEIRDRLHPKSSSSGRRNTASEKIVPVPTAMMATDAMRTTQP
jgi:hypothetical protein